MILKILQKSKILRTAYFNKWGHPWVDEKIGRFVKFLEPNQSIIDIGSGNCLVCSRLWTKGFQVTPVDVENLSYSEEIRPVVYDGTKLPFQENEFDVALLLTVLHHTADPEQILLEALRVSGTVVIIEDVYRNPVQKLLTYWIDLFINLGFSDLPFNHRSDNEWQDLFDQLGLQLTSVDYKRVLLLFRQATYVVKKKKK